MRFGNRADRFQLPVDLFRGQLARFRAFAVAEQDMGQLRYRNDGDNNQELGTKIRREAADQLAQSDMLTDAVARHHHAVAEGRHKKAGLQHQ